MVVLPAALRSRSRFRLDATVVIDHSARDTSTASADALQVESALELGETAFVTDDFCLRRITELSVIVLAGYANG